MAELNILEQIGSKKNIEFIKIPVVSQKDISSALTTRFEKGIDVDAIQILPEPLAHSKVGWTSIQSFAEANHIPIIGTAPYMLKNGAIISFNVDYYKMGEFAAPLISKIIKGTPAGDIPVVSPEMYLRINKTIAEKLNIEISKNMLKQAVEIIR